MYVGMTKGQSEAFKHFLAGDVHTSTGISSKFLEDPMKCIHMFQEANDHEQCSVINNAKTFENRVLNLQGVTLLPRDTEALSVFLTESKKQWEKLN